MTEPRESLPEGEERPPRGVRAMAVVRWLLVLVMAVVAAASIYRHLARDGATVVAAQLWHCPMHPSVVQDHPGDCPICNMTLVEVAASAPAEPAAGEDVPGLAPVELSAERVQMLGLRTGRVERGQLESVVLASVSVQPSEGSVARVAARTAGWIESLVVAETGRVVRAGQVLARVSGPEYLAAQRDYRNALRWATEGHNDSYQNRSFADDLVRAALRRLELLGIAAQDLTEIARASDPLPSLPLRAPVSGVISRRSADPGQWFEPGMDLYEIADLSTIWVQADLFESEAGRVAVGDSARVTLTAWPGREWLGSVGFVAPSLDPETRTLRARVALANPKLELKPGMYGQVAIASAAREALLVPIEAVADSGLGQWVFLALAGGRFEPRTVRLGERAGDRVEVLSGVEEGDQVVTTAAFLLDSESRLRAAIAAGAKAPAQPGHER